MKRKTITKFDILLISSLLITALIFSSYQAFGNNGGKTAVVITNGETMATIELSSLTEQKEITLENGAVILAEKNKIAFKDSPCKDKLCVKHGDLTDEFDVAVCVPTKTIIKIVGKGQQNIDIMTY